MRIFRRAHPGALQNPVAQTLDAGPSWSVIADKDARRWPATACIMGANIVLRATTGEPSTRARGPKIASDSTSASVPIARLARVSIGPHAAMLTLIDFFNLEIHISLAFDSAEAQRDFVEHLLGAYQRAVGRPLP